MTITLDDVPTLVSIPVMGHSVNTPREGSMQEKWLLVYWCIAARCTGWVGPNPQNLSKIWMAALQVLRCHCCRLRETIQCAARANLLYLVGYTLFNNKRKSEFPSNIWNYLRTSASFNVCLGSYVFAYLYRQLGYASRGEVKQITGYLSLLDVLLKLSCGCLNILYEYTQCDLINMHSSMSTFPACVIPRSQDTYPDTYPEFFDHFISILF